MTEKEGQIDTENKGAKDHESYRSVAPVSL